MHNVSQRLVSKVLLTAVFDVNHALAQYEAKRFFIIFVKLNRCAILIQKNWRPYPKVKHYQNIRVKIIKIQSVVRMHLARIEYVINLKHLFAFPIMVIIIIIIWKMIGFCYGRSFVYRGPDGQSPSLRDGSIATMVCINNII